MTSSILLCYLCHKHLHFKGWFILKFQMVVDHYCKLLIKFSVRARINNILTIIIYFVIENHIPYRTLWIKLLIFKSRLIIQTLWNMNCINRLFALSRVKNPKKLSKTTSMELWIISKTLKSIFQEKSRSSGYLIDFNRSDVDLFFAHHTVQMYV